MKTYQVNQEGFYGDFGGAYIPEILHRCVEELRNAYRKVLADEGFQKEYNALLKDYVGRPSPLYLAQRLSEKYGCKIYLKREDLNHTGAHKINNAIGQVLLARRMGKKRIIAETGAGQHHGYGMCPDGNGMCGLHGKDRCGTATGKRGAHADAGSQSGSRDFGQHDPEGCYQRSHTRLVLSSG